MTEHTPSLPGLDARRETRDLYGDPREVHVDCLTRYPEAVVRGMRRELELLERAGIPAFADGRRIWMPHGSFFISMDGTPSRFITSVVDFDARARHVAARMATHNGYSFTRTFYTQYLQEEPAHA